jgi:hypothetical protein
MHSLPPDHDAFRSAGEVALYIYQLLPKGKMQIIKRLI